MDDHLALSYPSTLDRLTISEGFMFLWRFHFRNRPCARTYQGNAAAINRLIGGVYLDEWNEMHTMTVMDARSYLSDQTLRHDLALQTILYNQIRRWKRKRLVLLGIHFGNLKVVDESPLLDIKKPRGVPRRRIVTPEEFSRFMSHAPVALAERAIFSIDTGISEIDLKNLTLKNYNPETDCIDFQRHKTKVNQSIPVSGRVRTIIQIAFEQKRNFLLSWVNHRYQFEETLEAAGLHFQWRDLRKSNLNAAYRFRREILDAQAVAGHKEPSTTWRHYIVAETEGLKEVILHVEQKYKFSVEEKSC